MKKELRMGRTMAVKRVGKAEKMVGQMVVK